MVRPRDWIATAAVGVLCALIVGWMWSAVDRSVASCADLCQLAPPIAAWVSGPPVIIGLGWALLRIAGLSWPDSLRIALVGPILGFIGLRTWDTFVYGTPRPPFLVCALAGALGYLAAAAATAGRRSARWR